MIGLLIVLVILIVIVIVTVVVGVIFLIVTLAKPKSGNPRGARERHRPMHRAGIPTRTIRVFCATLTAGFGSHRPSIGCEGSWPDHSRQHMRWR